MRTKRIFPFALSLLLAIHLNAQDAIYSQFYAAPTLTNPALAGVGLCGGRAVMQYRNQWPSLGNNFRTLGFAYDQVAPKLGGGYGVSVLRDVAGDGLLTTTSVNLIYNYRIELSRDWSVYTAFQGTFVQRSINFDKLTFADQIDPKKGFVRPTEEARPNESISLPSISTGAVLQGKGFYAGVSVFHLNQPAQSFYGTSGPGTYLPGRMNLHAGLNLRMGNRRGPVGKDEVTLSPNVLFSIQEKFTQLNLGFYLNKGGFVTGVWFRQSGANPDALIAILGWQGESYKIGYSYDVTVSQARAAVKGSHEFSFAYMFCLPHRTKPNWLDDNCPKL